MNSDSKEGCKLMSITEVAAVLGVRAQTLRKWVDAGEFPKPCLVTNSKKRRMWWQKKQIEDLGENAWDHRARKEKHGTNND